MKKKLLVTLVCTCLAVSVCACGKQKDGGDINTTSVGANSVEEPALEVDEKPTTEVVEETTTETVEETTEVKEVNSTGESNESDPYAYTEQDGILVLNEVILRDKSDEYGVYSTSSEDAKAFLNEDGSFNYHALGVTGEVGNYDYSGRFAYPELKASNLIQNIKLSYRSDSKIQYSFTDDGEYQGIVTIYLGNDNYAFCYNKEAHVDGITDFERLGDYTVSDGSIVEVMIKDDSKRDGYNYTIYRYPLGAFTVEIQRISNDETFTDADFQSIIDNIVLK